MGFTTAGFRIWVGHYIFIGRRNRIGAEEDECPAVVKPFPLGDICLRLQIRKMLHFKVILILVLSFNSCTSPDKPRDRVNTIKNHDPNEVYYDPEIAFLDSIINVSVFQSQPISNQNKIAVRKEVERAFYSYFKGKGVLSRNEQELQGSINLDGHVVDLDTILSIHTKDFSGAVVSYWRGPQDLNGNCFQPDKALLINTQSGYIFANEQFLPSAFTIDSITAATIHGYEFQCGDRSIVRKFRITLR